MTKDFYIESPYIIPEMTCDTGSIAYMERLFIIQLIYFSQARNIIETGCFKGQTAKFLSRFLKENNLEGHITSFDMPKVIKEIKKQDKYFSTADNVDLIGGALPESLTAFLDKDGSQVDFALVDSEHSYNQVSKELAVLDPYLKEGAYVFCHDYRKGDKTYEGVVRAINEFSEREDYSLLGIQGRDVWGSAILMKKHSSKPPSSEARPKKKGFFDRLRS